MSRHKTTIRIVLVAAVLLFTAGASAEARGVAGREQAVRVTRIEKQAPSFWQWMKLKLTRYAMAAN